jgi:hypothetical protein
VLKLGDGELLEGEYPISYRVFYTDYQDVAVEPVDSFTITVVDPCTTTSLTLLPSPFDDQIVWRNEQASQAWNSINLVQDAKSLDCGSLTVEFFYSDETPIDSTIFQDDRSNSPSNLFTVTQAVDDDYHYGSYEITYNVFYTDYPDISVKQNLPFVITVVDPCGMASENSLSQSTVVDQAYTVTDS